MILTKENLGNDYFKKNMIFETFNSALKKRNFNNNNMKFFYEKKNYIDFIKNLTNQKLKENYIKNIQEKEINKEIEKEILYKSNNSTINELLNNINGDESKKTLKKDSEVNGSNKKKRNLINLVDKNGEFFVEFIENDLSNKNNVYFNNNYINEEKNKCIDLKKIKKENEEKSEESINNGKEEKFKIKNFSNINNLNEDKEGFLFTLREKDDIHESIIMRNNNEINNYKIKTKFESKNKYINLKENESIICDKNNIDFINNFSLKTKRFIKQKNKKLDDYFNILNKKFHKSKSNVDIFNNQNKNANFKKISNFKINPINTYKNNSSYNIFSKRRENDIENKKNKSLLYNSCSYITDDYCDKMVKMNILSLKASNNIKKINEKSIGLKNKYFFKSLNNL